MYLLDTHLLVWLGAGTREDICTKISKEVFDLVMDPTKPMYFSAASIWEVAIKSGEPKHVDFKMDPSVLTRQLVDNQYTELPVSAAHAAAVLRLPHHHRDPFDRILLAQAQVEGITLLTSDRTIMLYTDYPVMWVGY